jgi:hypothetical protein
LFHRIVNRLEEILPLAKRVGISRASHITYEDNAEEFNKQLFAFLQSSCESDIRISKAGSNS